MASDDPLPAIAPAIARVTTRYGAEAISMRCHASQATVLLQGAHVVDWTPQGAKAVLWMPAEPRFAVGRATRGGIPVCWPWFGSAAEAGQPAHGIARTALWDVIGQTSDDAGASLTLRLPAANQRGVELTLSVRIDSTLVLQLMTRNFAAVPLQLSEALHTYFTVADIGTVSILGFDGACYADQLQGNAMLRQDGPIRFASEVDRVYASAPSPIRIVDEAGGRTILVESQGSAATVVWNPWLEKAARLGDLGPDGWRTMVCVESANAPVAPVTVPPGGTHMLQTRISLAG